MLKNIFLFYALLLPPIIVLALLAFNDLITPGLFALCMLLYALVYHPIVCAARLMQLGLMRKADYWKIYNPYWESKYFGALFLNRLPK